MSSTTATLGLYYNHVRYLNTSTGRFWNMDNYEGDPESPLSLHKYIFASADSVDLIDTTGNDSLLSISISTAINVTLETLPISAAIRAGQFAYRVGHGVDLGMAAQEAIWPRAKLPATLQTEFSALTNAVPATRNGKVPTA